MKYNCGGFEVRTAMAVKSSVIWYITPCSPVEVKRRFGGTYRLCFRVED
jgi:hypothetical protein